LRAGGQDPGRDRVLRLPADLQQCDVMDDR
jgi:hypothetical protein